jgi:hypothetical protein|tara:strand:+ start:1373 stop:1732 length:360 start_codon:yes stop_codon:yes gene_type:complete
MTLYVTQTLEKFSSNNTSINGTVSFVLTSQFARTDTIIPATIVIQNARYTELELTFPSDFKNEHKNGIYYYTIKSDVSIFEEGLVKVITEPGGQNGAIEYTSTPAIENREAVVYYRPNY